MTVGSIEGTGLVQLGSKNLEVGGNDQSTLAPISRILAAPILDGGVHDRTATGGSITKVGTGTWILTGDSTYTGGTTITGGAIQLGNGGTTGSLVGDIVNNAALIFNRSNAYTFAGKISGAGTVTQTGSGTTTLTGANTYSGGTILNAGELSVATDGNLGDASGALTFDGGILQVTGTSFTSFAATNRSIVWGAGGGGFDIAAAGNTFTVTQALGAGGALTKLGAGTLVLTGASTFSGDLNVAAGALTIDNGGSLTPGNVSVAASNSANATLTIQGSSTVTSSATSFPLIGVGSGASGLVTVTGARSAWSVNGSPLNASVILGRNGGTGTLKISDRGSGTFVGDLVIGEKDGTGIMEVKNSGTLKIEKNGYIGRKSGSNGTATVADRNSHWSILGELFIGNGGSGTLNINNHGKVSVATTTTVADSGSQGKLNITTGGVLETQRLVRGTGPAQVNFDGGILRATATNNTNFISGFTGVEFDIAAGGMTLDSNNFDVTAAAVLSGTGALTKIGAGTLTLSGTNSYQGSTFLDAGILSVAADANLGASSGGLTFNGGTLETTRSFISNRGVTLGTGGGTFDADANTGLLLSGRISGSGALTKTGAGALVLSGRNQYSGPTTLNAGVLVITGDQTAATGPTTVRNGGILGGSGTIGGIVNVESGGMLASVYGTNPYLLGGPSLAYKLTIQDDLTLASGAALDYAYFVSPNSSHDTLMINVAGDVNLGGATVNVANDSGPLAPGLYGLMSYSGTKTGTLNQGTLPAGTYVETALAGHIYLVNPAGLNLTYWNGSGAGSGSLKGGDGVWQGPAGNHNWSNVSGSISGPYDNGGFPIFAGSGGTVTVDDVTAGPISAAGMQFVADGYVITGDPITLVAAPIANSATITVSANAGAPYKATINSVLQGTTSLTKDGRGTLVLTGINTYSGGTTVNAGTLSISADTNLGTGALNLQHGGTLETTQAFASNRAVTLGTDGGVFKTDANLTLNGAISGAGALTKIGAGTLALSGTNTYGGGTIISAGTLQLGDGGTSGSIAGDVTNNGTLAFKRSDDVDFGNAVTGTGGLRQMGSGKTTLGGDYSALTGASSVSAGILAVNGRLGGTLAVLGGQLQGTGTVGATTNAAGGTIAPGNSIGTLTVDGNYTGQGGTLAIETVLGGDPSPTDLLVVTGATSGATNVQVTNLGGNGAPTNNGIKIVDVGGTSSGTFTLLGDFTFDGDPAIVAGAYAYRLYQGGHITPGDGDWYLRSTLEHPVPPPCPDGIQNCILPPPPHYQPGAPVYEAYGQALLELNAVGTLRERLGNRLWQDGGPNIATAAVVKAPASTLAPAEETLRIGTVWGRIEAAHASFAPRHATSSMDYSSNIWKLQAGLDTSLKETGWGELIGGLFVHYGTASTDVTSPHGDGGIDAKGYGFGGTLTWFGTDGLYVDGLAQATWYDSDLHSGTASRDLVKGNDGFGYALSLEAGKAFTLAPNWSVTPQAQLVYSAVDFDSFTDTFGSRVSLDSADSLKGRAGLAADYRTTWRNESGQAASARLYGIANLTYEMLDGATAIDLAGTRFATANDRLWGGLGVGGTYSWADNRYALHGELAVDSSLANFADSYAVTGNVGLKVRW